MRMQFRQKIQALRRDRYARALIGIGAAGIPALYAAAFLTMRLTGQTRIVMPGPDGLPGDPLRNYPVLTVPTVGLLSWSASGGLGFLLFDPRTPKTHYLSHALWWSGMGVEVLCGLSLYLA